jgi:Predicted phosphoesterases, related to the Icc protein
MTKEIVRIAAVGDLHCTKTAQGTYQPFLSSVNEHADILLLCGDLTDYGTPEEAHVLARELTTAVKIPMVGVLGNHDYESGQQDDVRKILTDTGLELLDGGSCEIHGVGFAGVKGYIGGFGRATLGAWGEAGIKAIVREALDEALKLESALARLRTQHRIVVLHYSPVQATVVGEPEAIFPFLGSSRLEEPLLRHSVSAVFHGHAHRGTLEGRTISGAPVYNVALPLLRAKFPDGPFYRIVELNMVADVPPENLQEAAGAQHPLAQAAAQSATSVPQAAQQPPIDRLQPAAD